MVNRKEGEGGIEIYRANSWLQLFGSPREEIYDYLGNVVGKMLARYLASRRLVDSETPNGVDGVYRFFLKDGQLTTVQKLQGGDVELLYYSQDRLTPHSTRTIKPGVGNINHNYSFGDLTLPNPTRLHKLGDDRLMSLMGKSVVDLLTDASGREATEQWEEIFTRSNVFPQRIGHRIFPDSVFGEIRKLKEAHPELYS